MKVGNVMKDLKLQRCVDGLQQEKVIQVEMEGNTIVCLDRAGAKPGDRVLVVMSHAAGRYSMETPSDAVVVAVVE